MYCHTVRIPSVARIRAHSKTLTNDVTVNLMRVKTLTNIERAEVCLSAKKCFTGLCI